MTAARFFAHSFDNGINYCVLDGNNHIVSEYDDMDYGKAHRLADEMNEAAEIDALDAEGRARLEAIANTPSLIAAE